jgi:hypothetical protein
MNESKVMRTYDCDSDEQMHMINQNQTKITTRLTTDMPTMTKDQVKQITVRSRGKSSPFQTIEQRFQQRNSKSYRPTRDIDNDMHQYHN